MRPDLDEWLPDPQVCTRHRLSAEADADRLWHAAETVRLGDAPTLGRAVRWRIPGTTSDLLFRDLLRQYPFAVINEGPRWSVSGMCGRIWTLRRDYPQIKGAEDFLAWDERGTVRVLLAHWIEGTALSKTRWSASHGSSRSAARPAFAFGHCGRFSDISSASSAARSCA
jgi:hypothetical protein